jgi:hypothetical protein
MSNNIVSFVLGLYYSYTFNVLIRLTKGLKLNCQFVKTIVAQILFADVMFIIKCNLADLAMATSAWVLKV